MFIKHFFIENVNETNLYLIGCPVTRQAAIIDAGGFESRVLDIISRQKLQLRYILITHNHFDHTDGLIAYCEVFPDIKVLSASDKILAPNARLIEDEATFNLGTLDIQALVVPGHTNDAVAWHVSRRARSIDGQALLEVSVVFSGDILFAGSVGGTSSDNAHEKQISGIRNKILTLPETTAIFPGHGPATTVGIEKHANPFLAG